MIGKTIAHYEISSLLGKGGMGEVYRAHDSKLGRDVAIKVLPAELSSDPERAARFDREARTLASLQHPNVASIYGFETADNIRFLVMELVEGEDLSERLQRGAIPVEEISGLAMQLAEGLDAAHSVGITHRDLKPANIKITSEGRLKILDFGLARAYAGENGSDTDLQDSPTITAMTGAGVILGTAAYMSPEQARGKSVTYRADIWAYGVVLFEMLSGKRLFDGETVSDTLASVLQAQIPWSQLPEETPPTIRRLIERCLERDPSRRLQAIAEARIALEDLNAGRSDESIMRDPAMSEPHGRRERIGWIVAVGVLIVALVASNLLRPSAPEPLLTQSVLAPPYEWDYDQASPFALSRDGRHVAFIAVARPDNKDTRAGTRSIWLRDLSQPEPHRLFGTNGAAHPFWSPDGKWIAFRAEGKLNKIESRGGPVLTLCDAADGRGGSWNESGTIIFQKGWSESLLKVSAGGGTAEALTTLNKEHFDIAHRWPSFLPDQKHYLYYVVSTTNTLVGEHSGIYVGNIDTGESKFLLKSESRALYSNGHLLYRKGTTLMARPFDTGRLEFTGDPFPVSVDVPGGAVSWGGAHFGASDNGTIVHARGTGSMNSSLNWHDRSGEIVGTLGEPGQYWEPAISHNGLQLAVATGQDVGDIWVWDLGRGTQTRFTFDPADDRNPLWSPDDSRILFESSRGNTGEVYVRPASGQGDPELLYTFNAQVVPSQWSNDGRYVFVTHLSPDTGDWDVWAYDFETSEASPVVSGPFNQYAASLSHDGRWLAFASDESGLEEVYVQAFPVPQGRWMVSNGGGSEPVWTKLDRELIYVRDESEVFAVSVLPGENISFGKPENLFRVNIKTSQRVCHTVSDDGKRILINELPPADPDKSGARLIQNWTAALEK